MYCKKELFDGECVIDVIPSHKIFSNALTKLRMEEILSPQHFLKRALKDVVKEYDLVIIDCPPSLDMVTANALNISTKAIIPLVPSEFAIEGVFMVLGELKIKSSKNLFRKLNERSKELQVKQEVIAKKHNSLVAQCDELEHLKNNMNDYLGKGKTEKKRESVIGAIMKHRSEERENSKEKNKISKEAER